MRFTFPRILMLCCGLLLALPPGWCCIFAIQPARKETRKIVPHCPCCCDKSQEPNPTPKPAPHKPQRCPCADRQTTTPDSVKAMPVSLTVLAVLPVLDPTLTESLACTPAPLPTFVSSSPQLLHCVWLC